MKSKTMSRLPGVASEGTRTFFMLLLVPNSVPKRRLPRAQSAIRRRLALPNCSRYRTHSLMRCEAQSKVYLNDEAVQHFESRRPELLFTRFCIEKVKLPCGREGQGYW